MQPGRDITLQLIPDIALPVQLTPSRGDTPEKRLLRAVLADAIKCLSGTGSVNGYGEVNVSRRTAALQREAEAWILSDTTWWPISFVNVCQALGIEAGWVRRRLLTGPSPELPQLREGRGKVKVGVRG